MSGLPSYQRYDLPSLRKDPNLSGNTVGGNSSCTKSLNEEVVGMYSTYARREFRFSAMMCSTSHSDSSRCAGRTTTRSGLCIWSSIGRGTWWWFVSKLFHEYHTIIFTIVILEYIYTCMYVCIYVYFNEWSSNRILVRLRLNTLIGYNVCIL